MRGELPSIGIGFYQANLATRKRIQREVSMTTSDPAIRLLIALAHDIRTPLHVMTLKLTLLERRADRAS